MAGYLTAPAAPVKGARVGGRVVVLGASIENLSSYRTATNESFGKDWPTYAMLLSGGRFNLIQNMAIGGQTTDQFIARFDTDVTPYRPTIVPLGSVENDIQLGTTPAAQHANIRTLTAKCRAIGATPVWRSAMPHFNTGVHTPTGKYNAWLRRFCSIENLPFVDFWSVLVDPTTGLYKVGLTAEVGAGIHPNEAGAYLLAQYWLAQMTAQLPPSTFEQPKAATDTGQLLPTPLFLTGTAGSATSWNAIGGSPAGVVRSLVPDPAGYGQMMRHAHTASAAAISSQSNSGVVTTAQASPGEVMEVSGVLTSDGGVPASVVITLTADPPANSISRVPVSNLTHVIDRGTYKQQFTVPAGFVRAQATLTSGPGTGVVDFGYPVLRNLTRDGADPI